MKGLLTIGIPWGGTRDCHDQTLDVYSSKLWGFHDNDEEKRTFEMGVE